MKLIRTDNDELYINDGEIILAAWIIDSHHETIIIKDAYGNLVVEHKISADNPIEISTGEVNDAATVISNIKANFRTRGFGNYYQWIFTGKSNEIEALTTGYGYKNYGTENDLETKIGNVQIATFDGTSYLSFVDLDGATIVSTWGTSVATKISDQRIDFTAGTAAALLLSNGSLLPLCEGQGVTCFDIKGVHTATIIGATLSEFWGTKSDIALPYALWKGYSKYYVCESAGTGILLGETDGSNLSAEKVVNGGFDTDSNWLTNAIDWKIEDGLSVANNVTVGKSFYQTGLDITEGKLYFAEFDIIAISGSVVIAVGGKSSSSIFSTTGHKQAIIVAIGNTNVNIITRSTTSGTFDNISVKEIAEISLLDTFKFKLKPTICDTYFLDSNDITSGSGYMYRQTLIASTLFRVDTGILTQLSTAALTYTDYQDAEPTFSETGIVLKVNDVEILTSSDTTYPTFKVIVVNNSVGDEFSHFSKDGVKYDVSNFCCGTGTYGVQTVINVE